MAQAAEELDYKRFWLAEHHAMKAVASSATSVVLAHIGAATSKIRIGAGGIMLPNHSPLVIAEQFGTLAELYPDRIDLGLGRAPGTDGKTSQALRRNIHAAVEQYPDDVIELQQLLSDQDADSGILAVPGHNTNVPLWMLGSSLYSAQVAAKLSLPYSFASHFAPDNLLEALAVYRHKFQPSEQQPKPYCMAGVSAVVADTDEQAKYLFTSVQQQFMYLHRGQNETFQAPVDSMDDLWSAREKYMVDHTLQYALVGSKESVAFKMQRFLETTGVDELIISLPIHDSEARLHALKLLAEIRDEIPHGESSLDRLNDTA